MKDPVHPVPCTLVPNYTPNSGEILMIDYFVCCDPLVDRNLSKSIVSPRRPICILNNPKNSISLWE